jgi:hypothetical protein
VDCTNHTLLRVINAKILSEKQNSSSAYVLVAMTAFSMPLKCVVFYWSAVGLAYWWRTPATKSDLQTQPID